MCFYNTNLQLTAYAGRDIQAIWLQNYCYNFYVKIGYFYIVLEIRKA